MKTKIVIVFILLASIAMFGTGAFAYFSSQTTNTGNISSGSLTLKVDAGSATKDCNSMALGNSTTVWGMQKMAPGQSFDGKLCLKNTGTIAAKQVTFEWVYAPEMQPLADRIFLTDVYDSTDPNPAVVLAQFVSMADGNAGIAADGKVSFTELAWLSNHYTYPYDAVSGGNPFLAADGGTQSLYMKFMFDEQAGNEFQNLGFDYTLKVTAEQRNVFP